MKDVYNIYKLNISLITFVVFTWFLKEFSVLAIPLCLGIILGLIFAPLLIYLRKKISISISLIIIVILFVIFSVVFSSLMISSLYSISNNYSKYQENILSIIHSFTYNNTFLNPDILIDFQEQLFGYLQQNILSYSRYLLGFSLTFVSQYIMVLFTMVFVLIERSLFYVKIDSYYNNDIHSSERLSKLLFDINAQVSRFILLKTLISLSTAVVIYIGFGFIGVDFKFVWALLTFLFNFIPTVGSIIISSLSIIFAFVQFYPDIPPIFFVILLTIITQMIVGNLLDPKIMGDNLNLSPLVIWLFLIYWGWVWGAVGALLAIPIAVIVRVVCEFVPSLKSIGLFMGNSSAILKSHSHHKSIDIKSTDNNENK